MRTIQVLAVLGVVAFALLAGATTDVGRREIAVKNIYEWRELESQLRRTPWHVSLTVVTNSKIIPWCRECGTLPNAVNQSTIALSQGMIKAQPSTGSISLPESNEGNEDDDDEFGSVGRSPTLVLNNVVVDCAEFPIAAPCGDSDALPYIKLNYREGSTEESFLYKGMNDPFGIVSWAAKRLPSSYVPKKFADQHVPASPDRKMIVVAESALTKKTPKEFEELNKGGKQPIAVAAIYSPHCTKCAENVVALEAASRLLNASGIRSDSVLLIKMPFDSVIVGKWLPLPAPGLAFETAQILVFLPEAFNNEKVHSTPFLYTGPGTARDIARMVEFYVGKPLLPAIAGDGVEDTRSSVISSQLRGLARSTPGKENDQAA